MKIILFTFFLLLPLNAQQLGILGKIIEVGITEDEFLNQFNNTDVELKKFSRDSLHTVYEMFKKVNNKIVELGYLGFINKKCNSIARIWGEFTLHDFFDFLYSTIKPDNEDKTKCLIEFEDDYFPSQDNQTIIFRISGEHWIQGELLDNSIVVTECYMKSQ